MPNVFDLLSWFFRARESPAGALDPDNEMVVEMADRAESETVTPAVLTNQSDCTDRPIITYLNEDEQPEYILHGRELLISDETDSLARNYPTRETLVVVSDRRVLFILGGRLADELWEVPFADIVDVYVNDEGSKHYFVVEGDRDSNTMTFFADVTIESNAAALQSGVEYVAGHVN